MDIRNQPALVTGGAKRVGRAIALALGRAGARVAVHCHHSLEEAVETVRLIQSQGADAFVVSGDLADPKVPDRIISEVTGRFGELSILVNSASVFEGTPWPAKDDDWLKHFDVNLHAPMRLIREATPALRRSKGVVINIIDAAWQRPTWKNHSAYIVSKAALAALTQNLANVLAPDVRVNGVAPGDVLPPPDFTEAQTANAVKRIPMGRWGEPEDVAEATLALIRNDYISGQILAVDGGRGVV